MSSTTSTNDVSDGLNANYVVFTVCGISAVVTNAIIVLVYNSTPTLRNTYRLVAALALADLLNGLSFAINGEKTMK